MDGKFLVSTQIFTNKNLFAAEAECGLPLRLIAVGLSAFVDQHGVFEWSPENLKSLIIPFDTIDFVLVLNVMIHAGYVRVLKDRTKTFGQIVEFESRVPFAEVPAYINVRP